MRKFVCEFCGHARIFHGKEARKFRRKVTNFTCPRCGRKQNPKKRGK